MATRRFARILALLVLAEGAFVASASEQAVGIELGFLSVPLLTKDPYSFAASAAVRYQLSGLRGSPWGLGAWLGAAGFRPMDEDYGASTMYYGGIELGYRFSLFRTEGAELSIVPVTRLGWYLRSVEIQDAVEWGSRPFLSAGAVLGFRSGELDLGFAALISVPLDNKPVVLAGLLQRVGLWL